MGLPVPLLLLLLAVAGQAVWPAECEALHVEAQLAPNNSVSKIDFPDAGDNVKATVHDSFDLAGSKAKDYMAFLANLDNHVSATAAQSIKQHPVLARQQLTVAPATWFNLTLTGEGKDSVGLILRSDNLYISGFTNKDGKLFAFQPQGNQYVLPGATLLSFGGGYPDLFGKKVGAEGLRTVQVSQKQALAHLKVLANHKGGPDGQLKLPSAFFVLITAEAERFPQIRRAVFARWENPAPTAITDRLTNTFYVVDLVTKWRVFSCALLSWHQHGETADAWSRNTEAIQLRSLGVARSSSDALSKVTPILRSTQCTWT